MACEAKPKTSNKYVACRPNQRHKCIEVDRKELEPSESDLNVAELVKYKEALLRARRRLSDLNPPSKAPTRPPPPKLRFVEETDEDESDSEEKSKPATINEPKDNVLFKGLKKSKVSRSQLSFDQVYFDREDGVKLPIIRRGDASDEEDNHDTISCMSLPAVLRAHSVDDSESQHISTQTIEEEKSDDVSSEETPLIEESIRMQVQKDGGVREHSIEEIKVIVWIIQ